LSRKRAGSGSEDKTENNTTYGVKEGGKEGKKRTSIKRMMTPPLRIDEWGGRCLSRGETGLGGGRPVQQGSAGKCRVQQAGGKALINNGTMTNWK